MNSAAPPSTCLGKPAHAGIHNRASGESHHRPRAGHFTPGGWIEKQLFLVQSGWRWDMLTIEVASGGRIVASCNGQRKDHRFQKSNARTHAEDYEIQMHLALEPKWHNPATSKPQNEAVRRQFYRFRKTLDELIGIPSEAFDIKGDDWKPNFVVMLHKDLSGVQQRIASSKKERDVFEEWHPLAAKNSSIA